MILSVIYFAVYFSIFMVMLFLLLQEDWQKRGDIPTEKVKVSILIAARNEALNIERCLNSILNLNYPPECLEVIIGDDASTDNTHQIVADFIADKPNFRLFPIKDQLGSAKGKANVLAHLAHQASSDYFFITDADMELPADWVEAMLSHAQPGIGIVTGITTVNDPHFFARMQGLDWLNALGMIQVVSELNLPVTTMGNNMLVTRQAYESTGGYERFPFSITEDLQLFREVLKKGFGFKNVFNEQVLAFTKPTQQLRDLLQQRKRWMKGAMHLPYYMKFVLILYASFYAVLMPFFFKAPFLYAFGILFLKWLFQSLFLHICLKRVKRSASLLNLLLFEVYQVLTSVLLIIFFFLPVKVNWKGRKY
jgi:cellulose synthase/poly-beta-1,6-N-acetylglucosamine synthase-like glycosyltransferase